MDDLRSWETCLKSLENRISNYRNSHRHHLWIFQHHTSLEEIHRLAFQERYPIHQSILHGRKFEAWLGSLTMYKHLEWLVGQKGCSQLQNKQHTNYHVWNRMRSRIERIKYKLVISKIDSFWKIALALHWYSLPPIFKRTP